MSESQTGARFSGLVCDNGENTQPNRECGPKVDKKVPSDRSCRMRPRNTALHPTVPHSSLSKVLIYLL